MATRVPGGFARIDDQGRLVSPFGGAPLDIRAVQSRSASTVYATDFPFLAQATVDGSIDAFGAIQAAVDHAATFAQGAVVVIPEPGAGKYYRIKRALKARSGVTVVVPDTTRVICTGDAPGVEWPTYGCLLLGGYTTPNYWRAPAFAANSVVVGQQSVTLQVPDEYVSFIDGDVVSIEATSTYTIGAENRPTWLQMNVVESVSQGGMTLRHPIDTTQASVKVRNLTTNLKVQEASGSLSDYDLKAVRDFSLYGGTWETTKPEAPFMGDGGAINCVIKPYKTRCSTGVAYGNLFAHCQLGEKFFEGRRNLVELGFGSHDNECETFSAVFQGSGSSLWVVAIGEGSRKNNVRVSSVNTGSVIAQRLAYVLNSSKNNISIKSSSGSSLADAAASVEWFSYPGTPPNASQNYVDVGYCDVADMPRHMKCSFNANDNELVGTFSCTPSSGQSVTPGGGHRNTFRVNSQAGSLAVPTGTGNRFFGRIGSSSSPGTFEGVASNKFDLSQPDLVNLKSLGYLINAATFNSALPFLKSVVVPANTLKAGDRLALRLRGKATGASGAKTISVSFGGVSLFSKTVPSGQAVLDLDLVLVAVSSTSIAATSVYIAGASVEASEVSSTSLNIASTTYSLTVEVNVVASGDLFDLRSCYLEAIRPQSDGRMA